MGYDEKKDPHTDVDVSVLPPSAEKGYGIDLDTAGHELNASEKDILNAEVLGATLSDEQVREILVETRENHEHDQNFDTDTLHKIIEYLDNPDIQANPQNYKALIDEMRIEAGLIRGNSPYAMVRGVVDPIDDPEMPSSTFRVWFIGILYAGILAFVNQLFSERFPAVSIGAAVAQFLAYPAGKLLERILPRKTLFTIRGRPFSLNPGPFNAKEQMLITIMANAAAGTPYTSSIIFVQVLKNYFNQPWARSYGYQLLNTLASTFVGIGIAGVCRRFLVWPAYCVWPGNLSTLALNKAFHRDDKSAVPGPFGRLYNWSRINFFYITFAIMFVYYWFPGYIFQALSTFDWIGWIAPNNNLVVNLASVEYLSLGLNPWPTFDYNYQTGIGSGLLTPLFTVMNMFIGIICAVITMLIMWFKNAWNTGYLPLNSNGTYDNTGARYNVSNIIDDKVRFVDEKYQAYSQPWMAAGNLVTYFFFFASYSATVSYTMLYHRQEIWRGLKGSFASMKAKFGRGHTEAVHGGEDVHFRLMQQYEEVSELWYMAILVLAVVFGIVGLACWPTGVSVGVVFYGIMFAFVFCIPIGIIYGITGQQVTLNVLAEFIGGVIGKGDALSLNYFKMYGYITTAQALMFASDQKLGHYAHIPPVHTFWAQIIAAFVAVLIQTAIFNFQLTFKGVCTEDAAWRMTCPGTNTFFTAAVFWGTVGPTRIFGPGSRYKLLLLGFPIGLVVPFIIWGLRKRWPRSGWLRKLHPVMIFTGGIVSCPYPVSMFLSFMYTNLFSWGWLRHRYPRFWERYNFVLEASFSVAIAIAAIIIFFGLQITEVDINWWGNTSPGAGQLGAPMGWKTLGDGEYFGPAPGTFV